MSQDLDLRSTEERLARVSVLQELSVAALDLFAPARPMDEFLERLAERFGCSAAVCVSEREEGRLELKGAAGLSRSSRSLPLPPPGPDGVHASLPYPELAEPGLTRWSFEIGGDEERCFLLLFFEREPQPAATYRGLAQRLAEVLRGALQHRALLARAIESERRLSEQKTLLECQNEASLEGCLFVAGDGKVSFNRRLASMFQLPVGEPLGAREIFRRLDRQITAPAGVTERLESLLGYHEEQCGAELSLYDARTIEVSCVPVRSGDGTFFGRGFYFRDVTERHRAEEERVQLLHKEQQARALAEAAQKRAALLADASRILATSLDYEATLERVAHLPLPEFADWCAVDIIEEDGRLRRVACASAVPKLQQLLDELRLRYPPDPARPEGVGKVLATNHAVLYENFDDTVYRVIARDDRHLQILRDLGNRSSIMAPLTARGRLLGAISLVYGPSGRQYTRDDLALAEELACRAALAVDNARLYFRMQEAVRARDEFLSIASHELRTPITSLQLAAQGILRSAKGATPGGHLPNPGFVMSSLEVAVRQATRMATLVDKLLDVSRIQAGRIELQLEDVDLASVVREMVAQSSAEAQQAGCQVRLSAPQAVVGRWDKARIEQVVANLLSNALKYGAGKPVEVGVSTEGPLARLVVTDRGIGIAPDQQAHIFERFERAVSSHHYSGLGLGLYIVRRVLEALGGSVKVVSHPDQGASFTVELPLAGPAASGKQRDGGKEQRGAA